MSYDVLESKEMYKGKILKILSDKVTMPNGDIATRETVVRGNAAAIVACDENGYITFVRQYRHPAKKMILEIPAGMLEENENPKVAAIRELEEETGIKAEDVHLINAMYASVGICTEKIYIYIAEGLSQGQQNLDPDEFVEIEKYTLDEAINMIFDGRICDSKTIAGLLSFKEYLNRKNK